MTTKKHLSPDAFIRPAMVELNIDFQDEALFWKFVREKADRIDVLWAEFLEKEALDRQLSVEQMEKMAGNMLDRNGKPVDLRISSGFDLKI